MEKQIQEDQLKSEQDVARSKEELHVEELNHLYHSCLLEEEQLRDLKESPEKFELGGLKTTKFHEEKSTENRSSTPSLGQDMWKQLKRVSMEIKNCTKDGKQRSWHVLTKCPLHLSTSCFSCVNIDQAKHQRSWSL